MSHFDGIHSSNRENVISRNKRKQENVYRLRTQGKIMGIPYGVYYMSCNLDHVLYDKRNSSDEEKEDDAYDFAKKCVKNPGWFEEYMTVSDFSVEGTYKETWEFIEDGMHSIERHSNLREAIKESDNDRAAS